MTSHFWLSTAFIALSTALITPVANAQHLPVLSGSAPSAEIVVDLTALGDDLNIPMAATLEDMFTQTALDDEIEDEFGPGPLAAMRQVYAMRLFKPVWSRQGAESLEDAIGDLFAHGITADTVLENEFQVIKNARFNAKDVKSRARADIDLSMAWLRIAQAVSGGLRDEGQADSLRVNRPYRSTLTDSIIKAGQGMAETELAMMEPENQQYKGLKAALKRYRDMLEADADGTVWMAIPSGKLIKPGMKDPRIPAITRRLNAEGYFVEQTAVFQPVSQIDNDQTAIQAPTKLIDPTQYRIALETQVKVFQKRHGLKIDGVIGDDTLRAMNESPSSKIDRIADTMHRWREQGDMGNRYIWANSPSFTAEGWNDGVREINMRTIVGKARHATPSFSDEIEYMVANPKWYVPVSIARRQKLPKMRKDAGYAAKFGYSVFDRSTRAEIDPTTVDWEDPDSARKYQFVQDPGDGNALGKMKIIFPNQYSVYLHGTPGKHLFDKAQRAFSSGCVRLEDPVAMSKWIARHDESIARAEIGETIEEGERERFYLDEHVPVHITYFTVTANDDGTVNFLRDIYKRDDGIQYVKKFAKPYVKKYDAAAIERAPTEL